MLKYRFFHPDRHYDIKTLFLIYEQVKMLVLIICQLCGSKERRDVALKSAYYLLPLIAGKRV